MARRAKQGPLHAISGYPKGDEIQDFNGNKIARIVRKSCTRVRPHERGAWISSQRCSYVAAIGDRRYHGRGRGDGLHVNLRQMKR